MSAATEQSSPTPPVHERTRHITFADTSTISSGKTSLKTNRSTKTRLRGSLARRREDKAISRLRRTSRPPAPPFWKIRDKYKDKHNLPFTRKPEHLAISTLRTLLPLPAVSARYDLDIAVGSGPRQEHLPQISIAPLWTWHQWRLALLRHALVAPDFERLAKHTEEAPGYLKQGLTTPYPGNLDAVASASEYKPHYSRTWAWVVPSTELSTRRLPQWSWGCMEVEGEIWIEIQQANLSVITKALAMGKGRIVQRIWYHMVGVNARHHRVLLGHEKPARRAGGTTAASVMMMSAGGMS